MATLAESHAAASTVVLLEPGIVRDLAHTLSGLWSPDDERPGPETDQLVAAARLRLYGASADRSGWVLTTTAYAHDRAVARGDAEWAAGFIPAIEIYDDSPAEADVVAMVDVLRHESHLDAEAARTLAVALLCEPVSLVVARDPVSYRHNRDHDLPDRLRIVDAAGAVELLELRPGEPPAIEPPAGSLLATIDPWWIPGRDGAAGSR